MVHSSLLEVDPQPLLPLLAVAPRANGAWIETKTHSMKSFSELSLSAQVKSNLARHGFTELTAVQEQTIEPALTGRDLVATAQTGTGKTLAFVLPLINLLGKEPAATGVRALVLSPTRELAIQIHETFAKMAAGTGLRAAVVVGGLNEKTQLQAIRKGAQVMIATPGRLCDFLSRQLINLTTVRMLVLDEADRMLDMGFLPTIKRIIACTPADRQTLFFSATIETSVKHLIEVHVPKALRIEVGCISKPVEQVDLHVYEVDADRKLGLLEVMLQEQPGQYLVFAAHQAWRRPSWPRNWPGMDSRRSRSMATVAKINATRH